MRIGTSYVDYVVPGVLLLCAVTGGSTTAVTVCQDMTGGIIDRFRALDVGGTARAGRARDRERARNAASSVLVIAVALGIGFRPQAWRWPPGPPSPGVLLLYVLALSWLAAAIGLLVSAPETANAFDVLPMIVSYASSAFVPVRTMPVWLHGFASHQPATPVIETLRGLLLGTHTGASCGSRWPGSAASWRSASPLPRSCSAAAPRKPDPAESPAMTYLGAARPGRPWIDCTAHARARSTGRDVTALPGGPGRREQRAEHRDRQRGERQQRQPRGTGYTSLKLAGTPVCAVAAIACRVAVLSSTAAGAAMAPASSAGPTTQQVTMTTTWPGRMPSDLKTPRS